ncbi:helix-turn-helix transcriptional regulator [Paenibacillus hexagrammi]|uniref:AraC family transcriptional regulator n=1 Tax=Paenibacillus hexagrammi TaxID=2908839 RepID=A0ABY3SCW2_9BACL|nr:AraC family transcriptional regulator [Paenibacillus sp. YPD9-1]UJF31781.1 AraC family transcriptional regulator [Paenibacillus sp. YPD9-1]
MDYTYKVIELQEGLPIRLVLHKKPSYSYHWHKEFEIFFVLQGEVHIQTTQQRYFVKKHDILLMNCNEIHASNYVGSHNLILIIQLDLSFCKQFGVDFTQLHIHRDELSQAYHRETTRELKKILIRMVGEMTSKEVGFQHEVMACIHHFITLLLRKVPYSKLVNKTDTISEQDLSRLNRILVYMNENYKEQISLKDFSKDEFLSFYYLSHFFKKKVGLTFSECLNQIRIQKAVECMLVNPSENMIDIAHSVGFPNVKSFNRSFKDKYQMTPYQYKKMLVHADGVKRNLWMESYEAWGNIEVNHSIVLDMLKEAASRSSLL